MPNLNIVVPMAGEGSRFAQQGYSFPKPLIQMPDGNPMIKSVIDCVNIHGASWHFIVRQEHVDRYKVDQVLDRMLEKYHPVMVNYTVVNETTEGAACTVLLTRDYIDKEDSQLLVVNSDQYFRWDPQSFFYEMEEQKANAGILTFKSWHPKWSFAKVDVNGRVTHVAEKDPISDNATVGVYWWKKGSDFVAAADEMIRLNLRVNGEFYVAPTFNNLNGPIYPYEVSFMAGVGTPEDLRKFEMMYWLGKVPQ